MGKKISKVVETCHTFHFDDVPKKFTGKCKVEDEIHYYKNGKFHREDGPAAEHLDGSKAWYINGQRHRIDGPAIESADGSKHWYLNGKLHRIDGPAIEYANGDKKWLLNDKLHRIDGPAIVSKNKKHQEWYIDGKLHREDGPAIINDGFNAFYFNGKSFDVPNTKAWLNLLSPPDNTKNMRFIEDQIKNQNIMLNEILRILMSK